MTNIELIINIPKEIIEYIKNNDCLSVTYIDAAAKAIINGTPLQKGHGRLIDADKIRAEIEQITDTMGVSYNQYVSKIDVLQIIDKYIAESEE